MVLERRLWRRFLLGTAGLFALLVALFLLFSLRSVIGRGSVATSLALVLRRDVMASADLLLGVAASLSTLWLVQDLRSSGVLVPLFAAGLDPRRIRRFALQAAAGTVATGALLHGIGAWLAPAPAGGSPAWYAGGGRYAWDPDPSTEGLVVFDAGDLGVWRTEEAAEAAGGAGGPRDRALPVPRLPEGESVASPPRARRAFGTLAVQHWTSPEASLARILATGGRWSFGAFLLLAGAAIALRLPADRWAWAWLAYLLLLPALATPMAWVTLLLWRDAPGAVVAALGVPAALLAALHRVDRAFRHRGLRLSS